MTANFKALTRSNIYFATGQLTSPEIFLSLIKFIAKAKHLNMYLFDLLDIF